MQSNHRILITGANGQVGWSLRHTHPSSDLLLIAPDESQLDITRLADIEKNIEKHSPDMVINTAAYTAVDKAETDQEKAMQVNAEGPLLLAKACKKANIPLIHFSTDYIFDGKKKAPYLENDTPNPLNVYGDTKLLGEKNVRDHLEKHIIVRVSGVFCVHGHNFVKTMLRLAEEREILSVVDDQMTCPTSAMDIATVIWQIASKIFDEKNRWGTYHYCATPAISWHGFAETIINEAKKYKKMQVKEIKKISSMEYHSPAKRLTNAVMDCHKIKTTFGISQIPWDIELKKIIKELLS